MTKYILNPDFIIFTNSAGRLTGGLKMKGIVLEFNLSILSRIVQLSEKTPFSKKEIEDSIGDIGGENSPKIISALLKYGVFIKFDSGYLSTSSASRLEWEDNGWLAAKLFHDSVVYSEFLFGDELGWEEQLKAMADISDSGAPPPFIKELGNEHSLTRPKKMEKFDFYTTLTNRRTIRSFNNDSIISEDLLSNILYYSASAMKVLNNKYFGKLMYRTSPSGGAMHPVEIYPAVINIQGIEDGIYHYNPISHALSFINKKISKEFLYEISQRQVNLSGNFLAFIITARFIRNFWKYRYAKSYAFTLFDVGHFVQTLILTCEANGLKCFLTPALNVKLSQEILELDNVYDECPVYLVVAGKIKN